MRKLAAAILLALSLTVSPAYAHHDNPDEHQPTSCWWVHHDTGYRQWYQDDWGHWWVYKYYQHWLQCSDGWWYYYGEEHWHGPYWVTWA